MLLYEVATTLETILATHKLNMRICNWNGVAQPDIRLKTIKKNKHKKIMGAIAPPNPYYRQQWQQKEMEKRDLYRL